MATNMLPVRRTRPASPSPRKEIALLLSLTRRLGEDCRHLVREPGYRAVEPSLRALDLYLCVLRPRFRRAETQRVPLPILQLSDRIQSKPGLPRRWAHGPGVSGPDRPQPRPTGPADHQDDLGLQAPAEISPANKAAGRMGGRGRETYV